MKPGHSIPAARQLMRRLPSGDCWSLPSAPAGHPRCRRRRARHALLHGSACFRFPL